MDQAVAATAADRKNVRRFMAGLARKEEDLRRVCGEYDGLRRGSSVHLIG
jgi:hypothetical protein